MNVGESAFSFCGDAELYPIFDLFLRERAEEVDLLAAWRLPLVVGLEGRLEVCLYVHVERLRLELAVRGVVHSGDRLG